MGRQREEAASHTSPGPQPWAQSIGAQAPARHTLPASQARCAHGPVFITHTPPGPHTSPPGQSESRTQVQRPSMQVSELPRRAEHWRPHSPQCRGLVSKPGPLVGAQACQPASAPQGRAASGRGAVLRLALEADALGDGVGAALASAADVVRQALRGVLAGEAGLVHRVCTGAPAEHPDDQHERSEQPQSHGRDYCGDPRGCQRINHGRPANLRGFPMRASVLLPLVGLLWGLTASAAPSPANGRSPKAHRRPRARGGAQVDGRGGEDRRQRPRDGAGTPRPAGHRLWHPGQGSQDARLVPQAARPRAGGDAARRSSPAGAHPVLRSEGLVEPQWSARRAARVSSTPAVSAR